MVDRLKYGKDYKDYTVAQAAEVLSGEGFTEKVGEEQFFCYRTLHHWVNATTTQRASISVANKTGVATISYSMLSSKHAKRRTAAEIRRANYVQYD